MKKESDGILINRTQKNLWFNFCAALIGIILVVSFSRDITRPFYGLHSWGEASMAWRSRSYFKYPVSYTKMLSTWAVGDPPAEPAKHYLDWPQLGMSLRAVDMALFGVNEASPRIGSIIRALFCLFFFLKILRGLTDDKTALLAGLLFVLFPIAQYFPVRDWYFPLSFLCLWFYLIVLKELKNAPEPTNRHYWGLGLSLFFVIQMSWSGFFYALAIGVHYVSRCIFRKKWPEKKLLAILIAAPISSMLLNFFIMAAGHGWNVQKIIDLYKWRAGSGEMLEHVWSKWFQRAWDYAVDNFTLPILLTAIAYLSVGQLCVWTSSGDEMQKARPRQFPNFWLFFLPGVFQLFLLKGTLWAHQYWERPLAPFVAVAAAMGVMLLVDLLAKIHRRVAVAGFVVSMVIFLTYCAIGTNAYYAVRWQQPAKIDMFKKLNTIIPPDKQLLSFDPLIVNQHEAKGAFYRPEVAWYLDRDIVSVQKLEDILKEAKTGKYPYYLSQNVYRSRESIGYLDQLNNELNKKYNLVMRVQGIEGEVDKKGRLVEASMPTYFVFDLQSPRSN
ncbi:MAG: hypothetical protein MUO22_00520 [Sedimentisphaerales bacterium]|nr:hypothetical protein [Sedimentisphaerales bacterium]